MKHYRILEKRGGTGFKKGDRYWRVEINLTAKVYDAWVERGRMVTIAFKPRGQNRGWKWHAGLRDRDTGKVLEYFECSKSTGLAHILEVAELVPLRPSELAKVHNTALWADHSRTRELAGRSLAEGETCPCALCRKDV